MSNTAIGTSAGANGTWAITPSMTLDSNGNLGIGTIAPGQYKMNTINTIVFRGNIEVERAANGFVVRIGTRQGDIATTYVAKDVSEVNGIITAEMVKFKLEDK